MFFPDTWTTNLKEKIYLKKPLPYFNSNSGEKVGINVSEYPVSVIIYNKNTRLGNKKIEIIVVVPSFINQIFWFTLVSPLVTKDLHIFI